MEDEEDKLDHAPASLAAYSCTHSNQSLRRTKGGCQVWRNVPGPCTRPSNRELPPTSDGRLPSVHLPQQ